VTGGQRRGNCGDATDTGSVDGKRRSQRPIPGPIDGLSLSTSARPSPTHRHILVATTTHYPSFHSQALSLDSDPCASCPYTSHDNLLATLHGSSEAQSFSPSFRLKLSIWCGEGLPSLTWLCNQHGKPGYKGFVMFSKGVEVDTFDHHKIDDAPQRAGSREVYMCVTV
jgi:hypothetical protein